MKKVLTIIFIILFLPVFTVQASDSNVERGADLYLQGAAAMNNKDFSGAKEKFEAAAQYLTGKAQEDALRMADFIGKMKEEITADTLLEGSYFSIVGEVKEEGRVWHFYTSDQGATIMHLALDGEKPLDDLVEAVGADLFTKEQVIKNKEGYLSEGLNHVPGAISRVRMWYCDNNNSTHIVYENYQTTDSESLDVSQVKSISDIFMNIECLKVESSKPEHPGGSSLWIIIVVILLTLGAIGGFIIYKRVKK